MPVKSQCSWSGILGLIRLFPVASLVMKFVAGSAGIRPVDTL